MSVLDTAHTAIHHRTQPRAPAVIALNPGPCARCATVTTELTPTRRVVSKMFTGYDRWDDPCGPGLCPACAWSYRTPALRRVPHQITTDPSCAPLTRPQLHTLLRHLLPATTAVVVPLRPDRKHLIASAQWGRITTDNATLTWTVADTTRLAAVTELRHLGFGPKHLLTSAPPWIILSTLAPRQQRLAQQHWRHLAPWRRARPWLDLALYASTP